ncbi:MAG: 23S rRNA (adenine(2503)-C(2))-methyltransferase RlmN [bacterium]
MMKKNLKSFSVQEIENLLTEIDEKQYHTRQILRWIYQQGVTEISQMTDLSKSCRKKLEDICFVSKLILVDTLMSKDGTCKYIFRLSDGRDIESVLIPDGERLTLCISTQLGCRQGCSFCLTAKMGFIRNLSVYEIIDQIIQIRRHLSLDNRAINIVLMGMGEPLDNYQNTVQAIRNITSPLGLNISTRHVTLSTAGMIPELLRLQKEDLKINLAISINAPNDKIRSNLMPINHRYNLESLLQTLRNYPLYRRQRFTIEYVLIDKINDSPELANELYRILKGIPCKINLIPYNSNPDTPFKECLEDALERFSKILLGHNLTVTVRRSRGKDIGAACGQLITKSEKLVFH